MQKRLVPLAFWVAASCALSLSAAAAPAQAQVLLSRTWVSSDGSDLNPCTRDAPCRLFDSAMEKTADGGEVNCVDPGSFGTINITQGLTINCTGTLGSVANFSTLTGVIINAPGKKVKLRGLEIVGAPPLSLPARGIRIQSAASVTLDEVFIHNQTAGAGIEISPSSGTVFVFINNSVLADNGNGAAAGIQVVPTGTALVRLSMNGVQVLGTTGNALRLDSTGTAGLGILTIIENSTFSNSSGSGISAVAGSAPTPFNVTLVDNSNLSNNGGAGISTSGAAARVRVSNTALSLNGTGISPGSGFINDLGDNRVVGNSADGAFN